MARGFSDTDDESSSPELPGYEIRRQIGRGGMGAVYLARQIGLDRDVAVKRVAAELKEDPMFLARLELEARTMAKLNHPNVVTVHHFEVLGGNEAAIVMEYVEGGNLRDRIDEHPDGMPLEVATRLIREISSALAAAHAAGVVHRDMKPENVLIGRDGTARVSDFGLAAPMDQGSTRLTRTGTTVGTIDYLAPERFRSNELDARSDLYSVAVVFYEMLTGQVPRGSFASPRAIRPELPRQVSDAVMRALRPDPAGRFDSMVDFIKAIDGQAGSRKRKGWVLGAGGAIGIGLFTAMWKPVTALSGKGNQAVAPTGIPDPGMAGEWNDALVDVALRDDVISGGWRTDGDMLITDQQVCVLSLEHEMPEAYDVRLRFTRLSGVHSIAVFFTANGTLGSLDIDGWDEGLSGVQRVNGRDLRETRGFPFHIENGRSYELLVQVRPGRVNVSIDGEERGTFDIGPHPLGIVGPWEWEAGKHLISLGIGSYESPTRFEKVEWREVGSRGQED
ncbi:serine/threonine-protein kinase [Haloferula sp.]|uniref:serine/threonine-protein kinase n=1 Tax=Haloferula sp. TaxID=2497595 RepID=UPI003C7452BC